jgi:hypothetical protein
LVLYFEKSFLYLAIYPLLKKQLPHMRASRQRLTLIINKVKEHLPDGSDIFDFAGISKEIIISSLNDSYQLLESLDTFQDRFETVFLERRISLYYERITDILKKANFEKDKDKFDEFLNIIQKIHLQIKETFILVAKEPIRTEIEIQQAKNSLAELQTDLDSIKNVFKELSEIKSNSESFISELKVNHKLSIENEQKIVQFLDRITLMEENASRASIQIPGWEESIKNLNEDLGKKNFTFGELTEQLRNLSEKNQDASLTLSKLLEELNNQVQGNEKFQKEIQDTIQDVNRYGMAGSFKKRKDELSKPLIGWQIATIFSIAVVILLSYLVLLDFAKLKFEWESLVVRIPMFASSVWLGWFCAKQYGFTSRIKEDYAYKYAVSMAFEGYKNATKEVNEELLKKLLETTIYNISSNPLNIYDTKSNHGTPYHELFDGLKTKIKTKDTEVEIEKKDA